MAKAPEGFTWDGFAPDQAELLGLLDHVGNNGWARNSQTEELMPRLLKDLAVTGVSLVRIKDAMSSIGYEKEALHQLDRWESKRTTGRFGR
jgi:hypothetical protein